MPSACYGSKMTPEARAGRKKGEKIGSEYRAKSVSNPGRA